MKNYALLLLNVLLEQLQKIDPEAFAILNRHEGKVIEITLEDIPLTLYMEVQNNNLAILPVQSERANLKITAPLGSFIKLFFTKNPTMANLVENHVVVLGDTGLLHALQNFLQNFNLDIEHFMALSMGEIPATQLTAFFQSTFQRMQDTLKNQTQNLSDYFTYEKKFLLSLNRFSEFS
ncbi:MAG TPA: SCP2 sterol-binding domain-containing protein, partial [Gammaproteobacteria bacterium]|nr:SCP2 sterol-binding domain-containing protein [Gammaproteobacteria bacterium]